MTHWIRWITLCYLITQCLGTMEDSFVVNPSEAYPFYPLGMEENVRLQSVPPWTSSDLHFGSDFQRLYTARAFSAGQVLLTLEETHAITTRVIVAELPEISKVEFTYLDEPFVLWLLYHRALGPDSPHFPFLSSLPRQPVHPLLFSAEQWALLPVETESLRLNEIVNEQRSKLLDASRRLFAHLEAKMPRVAELLVDLTFQEYLEAHVVVSDLQRRSGDTAFLFPALMAAHSPDGARPIMQNGRLVLVAPRDMTAGEPITLHYGNMTNAQFLLRHGIVPVDNAVNCAPITLHTLSPFWGLVAEKVFGHTDPSQYHACLPMHVTASDPILREVRAIVANHQEMDQLGDIMAGLPVSLTNEARMLRTLYLALTSQTYAKMEEENSHDEPALRLWKLYSAEHRRTATQALQGVLDLWRSLLTQEM